MLVKVVIANGRGIGGIRADEEEEEEVEGGRKENEGETGHLSPLGSSSNMFVHRSCRSVDASPRPYHQPYIVPLKARYLRANNRG